MTSTARKYVILTHGWRVVAEGVEDPHVPDTLKLLFDEEREPLLAYVARADDSGFPTGTPRFWTDRHGNVRQVV